MFPINFNFPYRKKDGSLITMEKALDGAGADLDLIDLDDVAISSPAEGDGLIYDNTAHKWKNIPIISRIVALFDAWKKNGAYNLCPNNRTTTLQDGTQFTVNANKTITATVPANPTTTSLYLIGSNSLARITLPAGKYKLVGCPSGGNGAYYIQGFGDHDYTTGAGILDTGSGFEFTLTQENEVYFFISIRSSFTSGGTVTFKPMITTDLNATYDDYVPYAKTNRQLTEDTIVKEIAPSNLSSANARISLESSDNIIIRKIGRLVIIEKLSILISAGADLPYNVGVLITGLPAPESAKCVLVATGNAHTDFKSVGFTVNANGSLIPASFNNIPANANNQSAYFIGGASYIAKE